MRVKVRSVEPSVDPGADAEEVVAGTSAETGDTRPGAAAGRNAKGEAAGPGAGDPRLPVRATRLGPNGDVVLDLLERAALLTPDECHRLDAAAAWRWWPVTPLPGTGMAGARATALVRGRAEGRADALAGLDSDVRAIVAGHPIAAARGSRIPACVANAGLALLVRDLIDSETFETLFGPWREVMHH